jgi:FAD:protein FMN transferase
MDTLLSARRTLLSPRRRTVLQALAAAGVLAACGESRIARGIQVATHRGEAMGSTYVLKVAGTVPAGLFAQAVAAVDAALQAVDRAMSTHRADSELSRLNGHASATPFFTTPAVYDVLRLAHRVSIDTAGAFDVTVAPLVDAWGFGPARVTRVVSDAEVEALAARIGFRMLELDDGARAVRKARPDVQADLSGIAKGHAVDAAAAALDALGIGHYLVEAGGEVRARGHNGSGTPWQIGIEQPDAFPQRPRYVVPLANRAMATSGDYRIYFERDGQRYAHEIDPATGRPMRSGIASVSVVAEQCALADAMGKLIVLPIDRAYATAERLGLAAHFVVRGAGGRLTDRMTPAFEALGGRRVPT